MLSLVILSRSVTPILIAAIGGQRVDSVAMPRTVRNSEVEELQALDLLDDKSKLNKRAKRLLAVACPETFPLGVQAGSQTQLGLRR